MSDSFNDYYFTLTSFAFSKGCERFEEVMPKSRVKKIIERLKKERGMEWFNLHGCKYIVHYAYMEENRPECSTDCGYRILPEPLAPQCNALRVEIMSLTPRCGAMLRYGRIGGNINDYCPCRYCP